MSAFLTYLVTALLLFGFAVCYAKSSSLVVYSWGRTLLFGLTVFAMFWVLVGLFQLFS